MKVAAVAWKIREIKGDGDFFGHLHDLVTQAHDLHADVVVFPELFSLELLTLVPDLNEHKVPKFLGQYAKPIEEWLERICKSSNMVLVGGSHFVVDENPEGEETPTMHTSALSDESSKDEASLWAIDRIVRPPAKIQNMAVVADPKRGLLKAPKNHLTRYEREMWDATPGEGLIYLPEHRIGVTICYDTEFPESGRALAEAGTLVQCAPAFTENQHGFQRVRWSCKARAIENQNYVVHSSLIGSLGREPVPNAVGTSAILCPSIDPFPENVVLAETPCGEEGLAVYDLDLEQIEHVRSSGEVKNWLDRDSDWQII